MACSISTDSATVSNRRLATYVLQNEVAVYTSLSTCSGMYVLKIMYVNIDQKLCRYIIAIVQFPENNVTFVIMMTARHVHN